jgi:hypothetical protein
MAGDAKAAGGNGGDRKMQISDWRPDVKGTRVAFFSLRLASGLVISRVMLHQNGEARWVQMHSEKWLSGLGDTPIVDFANDEIRKRFKMQVLQAVDAYFAQKGMARP